jgi:hypothetical protein
MKRRRLGWMTVVSIGLTTSAAAQSRLDGWNAVPASRSSGRKAHRHQGGV